MTLQKWNIHRCDQQGARASTQPAQPSDPIKPYRFFLIISPDSHLEGGGKATCLPLGEKSWTPLLDVPLKSGEAGTTKDCYIWCNHIFTIPQANFTLEPLGVLPHNLRSDVEDALRDYLGLY